MLKKLLIFAYILLIYTSVVSFSSAQTTVYNDDANITAIVGGSTYWSSNLTYDNVPSNRETSVKHKRDVTGRFYYRPGVASSELTGTIGQTPVGYGWATNFTLDGDLPAGRWTFQVRTRNDQVDQGIGYIGINVFKYCNNQNTRLFYVQGNTNVMNSIQNITQMITTDRPAFTAQGCRLKFEYWLNVTRASNVSGNNDNQLLGISTNVFSTTYPSAQGICTPGQTRACGTDVGACVAGTQTCMANGQWGACTGETGPSDEVCNSIDDDCDGLVDNGITCDCQAGQTRNCMLQLGVCEGSLQTCRTNFTWSTCNYGPNYETTETRCDSMDNDCDGQVDEGNICQCSPGQTRTCGTDAGPCVAGNQACSANGTWGSCTGEVGPTSEVCNSIDDDCDGLVDNGITCDCQAGLTRNCMLQSGVCQGSQETCLNNSTWGPCNYGPNYETTETRCDAMDNDCDSSVDEGCQCSPGQTRTCGTDAGPCVAGNQTCSANGMWGGCIGEVMPIAEICINNVDDDCDGIADNGCQCNSGNTQPCGVNIGACRQGMQTCVSGQWGDCSGSAESVTEDCDLIDNDCDGQIDENLIRPCSENIGECREGLRMCENGLWGMCSNAVLPLDETCDLLDNDCDRLVDEGEVCNSTLMPKCAEDWQCDEWSACLNATESMRACNDANACGTMLHVPSTSRRCFSPTYLQHIQNATSAAVENFVIFAKEEVVFTTSILVFIVIFSVAGWVISKRTKEKEE